MEMLLLICLATATTCTQENAVRVIHIPQQQMVLQCGYDAQSYIVHNAIEVEGMKWVARCKN